ncbi:MAG: hypothetical protein PHI85_08230 [Victivallaceae bacterium]|nr:hypothetical protein [Victivallaceae bacterium]
MSFYTPAAKIDTLPPLVSQKTRKRIWESVLAAHLLLIGLPLLVMSIAKWFSDQPENLMVIEIVNDLPPNPAPFNPSAAPMPPTLAEMPLQPSVLDTAPEPEPEPLPDPKPEPEPQPPPPAPSVVPAPVKKPVKDKPQNKSTQDKTKDKQKNKTDAKPSSKTATSGPKKNFTAVNPATLGGPRGSKDHDPSRPVGGSADGDAMFKSRLAQLVEFRWNEFKPNETQLGGLRPFAIIELDIAADGRILDAKLRTPTGVTAMDNAARLLCTQLKSEKTFPPKRDIRGFSVKLKWD